MKRKTTLIEDAMDVMKCAAAHANKELCHRDFIYNMRYIIYQRNKISDYRMDIIRKAAEHILRYL